MDEDTIAKAVKAAAGLGPLRAAVITHTVPHAPGARGRVRMLDGNGNRHTLATFTHVINVYLTSAFAVTSQASTMSVARLTGTAIADSSCIDVDEPSKRPGAARTMSGTDAAVSVDGGIMVVAAAAAEDIG